MLRTLESMKNSNVRWHKWVLKWLSQSCLLTLWERSEPGGNHYHQSQLVLAAKSSIVVLTNHFVTSLTRRSRLKFSNLNCEYESISGIVPRSSVLVLVNTIDKEQTIVRVLSFSTYEFYTHNFSFSVWWKIRHGNKSNWLWKTQSKPWGMCQLSIL